jgi:hypothetical protein
MPAHSPHEEKPAADRSFGALPHGDDPFRLSAESVRAEGAPMTVVLHNAEAEASGPDGAVTERRIAPAFRSAGVDEEARLVPGRDITGDACDLEARGARSLRIEGRRVFDVSLDGEVRRLDSPLHDRILPGAPRVSGPPLRS